MIFTSLIAFILPLLLAIHAVKNATLLDPGTVKVCFGAWTEPASELLSLRVLLFCAVTAVLVAIVGNIL